MNNWISEDLRLIAAARVVSSGPSVEQNMYKAIVKNVNYAYDFYNKPVLSSKKLSDTLRIMLESID